MNTQSFQNTLRVTDADRPFPEPANNYFWVVTLLCFFVMAMIHFASMDMWLADLIYSAGGEAWPLRRNTEFVNVFHEGGRYLSLFLYIVTASIFAGTYMANSMRSLRRSLGYLLTAVLTSLVVVSSLRQISGIDCPWSLVRYGGSVIDFAANQVGQCAPAGHASGGYAWVSLFLFCSASAQRWRWYGLVFALFLGAVFGISQQLRGAHFLSHDLWTFLLCWWVAHALYWVFFRKMAADPNRSNLSAPPFRYQPTRK